MSGRLPRIASNGNIRAAAARHPPRIVISDANRLDPMAAYWSNMNDRLELDNWSDSDSDPTEYIGRSSSSPSGRGRMSSALSDHIEVASHASLKELENIRRNRLPELGFSHSGQQTTFSRAEQSIADDVPFSAAHRMLVSPNPQLAIRRASNDADDLVDLLQSDCRDKTSRPEASSRHVESMASDGEDKSDSRRKLLRQALQLMRLQDMVVRAACVQILRSNP
uniref:Uncharacterized protein n=1 Tax=Plectus sambesii TaxID=2011161 RepID=A0A914V719_9BILA